ncbi:MAG: TonB-dependent receptor [Woeseiaceae bacterium]
MLRSRFAAVLTVGLSSFMLPAMPASADTGTDADEIAEITVSARRVANVRPAGTYASPATTLRFDPLTELQTRGLAEGQADVTVRGGVFENTGFKLGSMTIMDPQTGHYTAELPVDPAFLSAPAIYQGVDGAVQGFNAAVATVAYRIERISDGGAATVGVGGDSLDYQSLQLGHVMQSGFAVALGASRSSGDGTLPYGDHAFARFNLLLQHLGDDTTTDVVIAYQDKFFGWPGAYTGFASLPETDDTQTTLVAFNQRRETRGGWIEYGAFYRRLEDDYDFNRLDFETGVPGAFEHETRVVAVGFQGLQSAGAIDWRYGGQLTQDELVRSTDLTNGRFTDRAYATLTVVPSFATVLASESVLTWRAGATFDYSDRDGSEISPLVGVDLAQEDATGSTTWTLEYAATSQLPGYTALNSGPSGLFGGNPLLGRETARQLSASVTRDTDTWQMRATVFGRRDDDLVDWTYADDAPFARQANPVDLDVIGVEVFVTRRWRTVDLAAGYAWLDKDADYGTASVDASFYALNFARHRATLALRYRFARRFELRLDTEYRRQEDNPLRTGDDNTFLSSLSLQWNSAAGEGLSAALVVDNLTDSEFQTFPGTPAYGRQYSINATWNW